MKATIDKAGRVVIPRPIREQAGLTAATELEVTLEGFTVRLSRSVPGPKIERRGKRLVARPTGPADKRPEVDISALIERERDRWPW